MPSVSVNLYLFVAEDYLESMQTTPFEQAQPSPIENRLPHGSVLTLRRARGTRIVCDAGRLWLTEEGVAADFVLAAGQAYAVCGAGRVVVEAVAGDARIHLA